MGKWIGLSWCSLLPGDPIRPVRKKRFMAKIRIVKNPDDNSFIDQCLSTEFPHSIPDSIPGEKPEQFCWIFDKWQEYQVNELCIDSSIFHSADTSADSEGLCLTELLEAAERVISLILDTIDSPNKVLLLSGMMGCEIIYGDSGKYGDYRHSQFNIFEVIQLGRAVVKVKKDPMYPNPISGLLVLLECISSALWRLCDRIDDKDRHPESIKAVRNDIHGYCIQAERSICELAIQAGIPIGRREGKGGRPKAELNRFQRARILMDRAIQENDGKRLYPEDAFEYLKEKYPKHIGKMTVNTFKDYLRKTKPGPIENDPTEADSNITGQGLSIHAKPNQNTRRAKPGERIKKS
jgi:hypothetical protein